MSRGLSYDRVRDASRGIRHIRLDKQFARLYLDIERGCEAQTIDITDVYEYLKEMFTTDWQKQATDLTSERNGSKLASPEEPKQ